MSVFKSNERQSTANTECVAEPMSFSIQPDGSFYLNQGITSGPIQERPVITSRLTLRSKNPSDDPIIENNYLNDPSEIREFVDSIKLLRKLLSQPALAEYIREEMSPGPQLTLDEAL